MSSFGPERQSIYLFQEEQLIGKIIRRSNTDPKGATELYRYRLTVKHSDKINLSMTHSIQAERKPHLAIKIHYVEYDAVTDEDIIGYTITSFAEDRRNRSDNFEKNSRFEIRVFFITWILSGIIGFIYCGYTESWVLSPLHAYIYFLAGFFPALILSILSGFIRRAFHRNTAEQGAAANP